MREGHNNIAVETLTAPVVLEATANGGILDMKGYRWAEMILSVGDFTFTGTNKLTITMQEGDESDLSDGAAPSDYDAPGATSGAVALLDASTDKEKSYKVGYVGSKRYIRLVITEAGTVSVPVSIVGIKGGAGDNPVSTDAA